MSWKHRYSVLGVMLASYHICYIDRTVIASAIPFIATDLNLSPLEMGQVLSAFFLGYAVMQIPGGLLADRFGARLVLTGTIAAWSIMTALTGMAWGLAALLVIRVLFGLAEGPFPCAISKAISQWFPSRELSRATGLVVAAGVLGSSVAPILVVALILNWGWRSVFFAMLVPGVLLALVVWRYVRNSPAESPRVTALELKDYDSIPPSQHSSPKDTLLQSVRTPAVLWCGATFFFLAVTNWGLMSWLPTYLLQARGFSAEKMGYATSLAHLAGAVGFALGGYVCDKYFRHNMRLLIVSAAAVCASLNFLGATASSGELAVACFATAFLISGFAVTAVLTLPLVLVPKHAVGSALGIVNTAGQAGGFVAPLFMGYVLNATDRNFTLVIYCLVACTATAILPALGLRPEPERPIRAGSQA